MAKRIKSYIVQKEVRIDGVFYQNGDEIKLEDYKARQCGNTIELKPKKVKQKLEDNNEL